MVYIIIEENKNPTTDYYVVPLLENKNLKFIRLNHKEVLNFLLEKKAKIFIVRYLTDEVLKWIEKNRVKIEKIYYLMDDDLFDLKGLKELPFKYAYKIFNKAWRFRSWIIKNTQIFISKEYLKEKYQRYNPLIIFPYPADLDLDKISLNPPLTRPLCFYHATASHTKEFLWLKDLLISLQSEDLLFELVVDRNVVKLYNGLEKVWLINTMKWQEYLEFSTLKYRHIGLALLFDSPFNRGRSYVKFFNIMRSGAVGVYSEYFPLAELIKEFQAGVVLPMEVEAWKSAILELATSSERREKLFEGARKLLLHLKEKALEAYQKIPM